MGAPGTSFSQRDFLLKVYLISISVVGLYLFMTPWLQPRASKVVLLGVLGSAFFIGYVVTMTTRYLRASSHFYIVFLYLTLVANASITGGIGAPGTIWFVLCPMLAFITLSTKVARIWMIIILVTVAAFYLFEDVIVLVQFQAGKVWSFVSYLFFFPMMYAILRIFRREVSKRNIALTTLNHRLELERKMLEKSQSELVEKGKLLKEAETRASARSAKLSYYLDQLIEVKRMEEIHIGSLEYAVRAVTQFLVKSMTLENVAVWHVNPANSSLELFRYHSISTDVFERAQIFRKDFPEAYDMLSTGAIVIGNVHLRESAQLKSLFIESRGTHAMINCPYFIDGVFSGFISCRATERDWSQEDIIFVRAISDTIPLAFKSHARRQQQELLEAKQREITQINDSLERKVAERTLKLNERNKQLTDFAFTNAHHIRGPVCRLLGLYNLLCITSDANEIRTIAQYMNISVTELDDITRATSAQLNKLIDERW